MQFYLFQPQHHQLLGTGYIVMRVSGSAPGVLAEIRRKLSSTFPDGQQSVRIQSFEARVEPEIAPWSLAASVLGTLGVLAITLAGLGIYVVISRLLVVRKREFAIRSALGCPPRALIWLGVSGVLYNTALGVFLGFVLVILSSAWIADLLFQTSIGDASPYILAATTVGLISLLASLTAARSLLVAHPAAVIREP
jgi:ABC-type antimicrobial peptide transport system permease subunit